MAEVLPEKRRRTTVNYAELDAADQELPLGSPEWVKYHKREGSDPGEMLDMLGVNYPKGSNAASLWKRLFTLAERKFMKDQMALTAPMLPPNRKNLPAIHTLGHAIKLLRDSQNIVVLTGAGISVSAGIPDFRSDKGLYAKIKLLHDLPDPQLMFDIDYFREDPVPFFSFAKEIFPGNFSPATAHKFIRHLEMSGKLLRNYTQNIDTLEQQAGISNAKLVQCHGSFNTASCIRCKHTVPGYEIRPQIMSGEIPMCTVCRDVKSVMKPDIVFFGEKLPEIFGSTFTTDMEKVDLFIVIGSSLKVTPVSTVLRYVPSHIPQILINREVVGQPNKFDIELLGDCNLILEDLCARLKWDVEGLPNRGKCECKTTVVNWSDSRPPRASAAPNPKREGPPAPLTMTAEVDLFVASDDEEMVVFQSSVPQPLAHNVALKLEAPNGHGKPKPRELGGGRPLPSVPGASLNGSGPMSTSSLSDEPMPMETTSTAAPPNPDEEGEVDILSLETAAATTTATESTTVVAPAAESEALPVTAEVVLESANGTDAQPRKRFKKVVIPPEIGRSKRASTVVASQATKSWVEALERHREEKANEVPSPVVASIEMEQAIPTSPNARKRKRPSMVGHPLFRTMASKVDPDEHLAENLVATLPWIVVDGVAPGGDYIYTVHTPTGPAERQPCRAGKADPAVIGKKKPAVASRARKQPPLVVVEPEVIFERSVRCKFPHAEYQEIPPNRYTYEGYVPTVEKPKRQSDANASAPTSPDMVATSAWKSEGSAAATVTTTFSAAVRK